MTGGRFRLRLLFDHEIAHALTWFTPRVGRHHSQPFSAGNACHLAGIVCSCSTCTSRFRSFHASRSLNRGDFRMNLLVSRHILIPLIRHGSLTDHALSSSRSLRLVPPGATLRAGPTLPVHDPGGGQVLEWEGPCGRAISSVGTLMGVICRPSSSPKALLGLDTSSLGARAVTEIRGD